MTISSPGKLYLIGAGPGALDLVAPRVAEVLGTCDVVMGLDQYLQRLTSMFAPGVRVHTTELGQEVQRAQEAIDAAREGHTVALVSSGDIGTFAMASPALELVGEATDLAVEVVPGIPASIASASILGAPLGHDHCSISLSNLLTPWEVIQQRVQAAASGDFVTCLYNPRSKGRDWQLGWVRETMLEHRPVDTPVGIVRHASRPEEHVTRTTLGEFDPEVVDMYAMVIIGSSQTRWMGEHMVTPRGYIE